MKQVIGGKLYDTTKAEEIGNYSNGLGTRDFRNVDETLYKTKQGRFFLAGEGGPMTKYSRPCGNMTGGGSGIIPLDAAEARQWCEEHEIDAETIAKYFKVDEA